MFVINGLATPKVFGCRLFSLILRPKVDKDAYRYNNGTSGDARISYELLDT